jgi:glucokinase
VSPGARRVLAGDVGGTHARLALFEVAEGRRTVQRETVFSSGEYQGLEPIVREFLREAGGGVPSACLGVACPIEEGVCRFSNLEWEIRVDGFGERVGIPRIRIINDLEAAGYGVLELEPDDLVTLQEGVPRDGGPMALIGAGTGLGQGFLVWDQEGYTVHPSEGGHADFAATDPIQWRLRRHLQLRYGHVSWERLISGHGLEDAYDFLRDSREIPEDEAVGQELRALRKQGEDTAEAISHHALEGSDPLSAAAMEIFLRAFGAQAGNLALTVRATAGVFLAGGIAPKILPKLQEGPFLEAFRSKGRLTELMEKVPVRVIVKDGVGLLGAAAVAERL